MSEIPPDSFIFVTRLEGAYGAVEFPGIDREEFYAGEIADFDAQIREIMTAFEGEVRTQFQMRDSDRFMDLEQLEEEDKSRKEFDALIADRDVELSTVIRVCERRLAIRSSHTQFHSNGDVWTLDGGGRPLNGKDVYWKNAFGPPGPYVKVTGRTGRLAVGVVALDLWMVSEGAALARAVPAVVGTMLLMKMYRWNLELLGLRLRVEPSMGYWVKAALVMGAVLAVILAPFGLLYPDRVAEVAAMAQAYGDQLFAERFVPMCVEAPLIEEVLYRLILCAGLAPVIGRGGSIAVSGFAFALLHVVYGNPSPENLLGGFLLGWSYYRSGSILVPISLHAIGNLAVLISWWGLAYFG
ncbi:MAG: hypothetical protein CMJ48_11970 [Planctomycetaceae bacterium]|nr:hypothetical protein [Planctomycetaceae bacterium]